MKNKKSLSLLIAGVGAIGACASVIAGELNTIQLISSTILVVVGISVFLFG